MKWRWIAVLVIFIGLSVGNSAQAASLSAFGATAGRTKIAVVYANHAGVYEKAMERTIQRELPKRLEAYRIVDGAAWDRRLQNRGVENPIWLERADLLSALGGLQADYLVLFDLRAIHSQKKVTVFTKGSEAVGALGVKILNLRTGEYVYVGDLTAKESDMTVLLNAGQKSAAGKMVRSLMKELAETVQKYVPTESCHEVPRYAAEDSGNRAYLPEPGDFLILRPTY